MRQEPLTALLCPLRLINILELLAYGIYGMSGEESPKKGDEGTNCSCMHLVFIGLVMGGGVSKLVRTAVKP